VVLNFLDDGYVVSGNSPGFTFNYGGEQQGIVAQFGGFFSGFQQGLEVVSDDDGLRFLKEWLSGFWGLRNSAGKA